MGITRNSTQSPKGYDLQNLQGAQLASRIAGAVTAAVRLNMRTSLQDLGYLFAIAPWETTNGLVDANITFGYEPGNVKRYGAKGDFVTNDTAAIQTALNMVLPSGEVVVRFPQGLYLADNLVATHNGDYFFESATIFANSGAAQTELFKFQGAYSNVYNMILDCQWKSNYACALHWNSANVGNPSQSNNFYGLQTHNTLMGILFGDLANPLNCAQSENYVHGFHSRGTQNVIYSNQPNGFVAFVGGELASSKNEWDIHSPGVYNFTTANVCSNNNGVVRIVGCDLEKTESTLGQGFINSGIAAVTSLADCGFEIACQNIQVSAGRFLVHGLEGGYWNNGTNPFIQLSGSIGGQLQVSGMTLNKDATQAGANVPFLDINNASNWNVSLVDMRLENQLRLIGNIAAGTFNFWSRNRIDFRNVVSINAGGGASVPEFYSVSTAQENLLDLRGTDVIGNDIATWYHRDVSGAGTLTLNADVPVLGGALTLNTLVGGTLYTAGTYTNVPLTGGLGTGALATVTVAGGAVTVVALTSQGSAYAVGDVLSAAAANIGGTGSGFTITVATIGNLDGTYFQSMQCAATGITDFTNLDITSLVTAKATGIKCRPGEQYMVSGWFKMTSAGTASMEAFFATTAAAAQANVVLADQTNLITQNWTFVTGILTVPPSCAYMGVGMRANATTVRMVGLRVSKCAG